MTCFGNSKRREEGREGGREGERGERERKLRCNDRGYPPPPQVELKTTKRVYAMKVIKKDLVMDEEVGREDDYMYMYVYTCTV